MKVNNSGTFTATVFVTAPNWGQPEWPSPVNGLTNSGTPIQRTMTRLPRRLTDAPKSSEDPQRRRVEWKVSKGHMLYDSIHTLFWKRPNNSDRAKTSVNRGWRSRTVTTKGQHAGIFWAVWQGSTPGAWYRSHTLAHIVKLTELPSGEKSHFYSILIFKKIQMHMYFPFEAISDSFFP